MPLVEAKVYDFRLEGDTAGRLVEALTDAVAAVCGESVRAGTWVIVEGVPPGHWGIGGAPSQPAQTGA